MPQDNLPRILLSMPSPFAVPGPFFDSAMLIMQDRSLDITPIRPPGTVIHLARHDSLMLMRRGDVPEWDYLCFLDTDQVVSSLVLRRLVRHMQNNPEVGVVAPVIVQREGDPLPVCYKLVGQTPDGNYRYQEQSSAVVAYLSQFREVWLTRSPSPVLPLVPERETDILDLPDNLKAGLADPLYEVDAVGAGMMLLRGSLIRQMEPEQPSGLLCFPGDTQVSAPTGVAGATRRFYCGALVEITTQSGNRLAGTPNHPVLTDNGWVALHSLIEGDRVVCRSGAEEVLLGDDDVQDRDTSLSQIFDASSDIRLVHRYAGAYNQFHGDGQNGYVDVVGTTGKLGNRLQATLAQPGGEKFLPGSSLRATCLPSKCFGKMLLRALGSPRCWGAGAVEIGSHILSVRPHQTVLMQQAIDRRGSNSQSLGNAIRSFSSLVSAKYFLRESLHRMMHLGFTVLSMYPNIRAKAVCFRPRTQENPALPQDTLKHLSGYRQLIRQIRDGLSGQIALDQIVRIRKLDFSGHVYNLETAQHWYTANSIIAQNCSFASGGEDLGLCRALKKLGGRIFVDRGCHVGHMTHHSRGVADLCEWKLGLAAQEKAQEEADALLPTVIPDLLNDLAPTPPRPWAQIPLPPQPRFRAHVLEPVS